MLVITLEGIDGSGKTTLLENVKNNFTSNKNIAFLHSPISPFKEIKHTLKDNNYDNFLFYQASNSYLSKLIQNDKKLYVIDRFTYSTYIVHSSNKELKKYINDSFRFLNLIVPRMMFLVKADVNVCRTRISKRETLSEAEKLDTKSFNELYNNTYAPDKIEIKNLLFQDVEIIKNDFNDEFKKNVNRISSYINSILKMRF